MRWVVRQGDGATVREVLSRAGADASAAVREGRAFVRGGERGARSKRVKREDERVRVGDVLEVAAARTPSMQAHILAHDDDLVAADKPAGMPTIADHAGASHALVAVVARALGVDESRVHATSRLDRGVSGVVVFALTRAAAARLKRARDEGLYERRYVAIASRAPEPARGTWDAPIGRTLEGGDPRLRAVGGRDAIEARTRFAVVARAGDAAILAVSPQTGRTHQIRVHACHAGAPLVGDRAYGGPARVTLPNGRVLELRRIALHAARVVVPGAGGAALVVESLVPAELRNLWSALGGDGGAWHVATSCALDSP